MDEILIVSKSLFASYVKEFRIETSLDYPSGQWINLGTFSNSLIGLFSLFSFENAFLTRFLKISIISVDLESNTYFCSINQLRVYGKTLSFSAKMRNEKIMKLENDIMTEVDNLYTMSSGVQEPPKYTQHTFKNKEFLKTIEEVFSVQNGQQCKNLSITELFELLKKHKDKKTQYMDPYLELSTFFADNLTQILQRLKLIESNISDKTFINFQNFDSTNSTVDNLFLAKQNAQLREKMLELELRLIDLQNLHSLDSINRSKSLQRSFNFEQSLNDTKQDQTSERLRMDKKFKKYDKLIKKLEQEQEFYYKISLALGLFLVCSLIMMGSLIKKFYNNE